MRLRQLATALALILPLSIVVAPAWASSGCSWDTKAGWVARENAKTGSADWARDIPLRFAADYSRRSKAARVEGWVEATSATCGQEVGLHITSSGRPTEVQVFRMGYYAGRGARFIAQVTVKKSDLWKFKVTTETPPGQYLLRLSDGKSQPSLVPLMVRDHNATSDITFISSVLTWQSYNQWGGHSLYKGPDANRETRATYVSFDRPYDGDGSGQFRYMEFPALKLAEKLGLNINYLTDLDLHADAASLGNTKSILVGGHSEYWTNEMRTALDEAVSRGINLVSLGGNTGYNHTTLQAGNRSMGEIIPWRANPINKPESLLLGSQYISLGIHQDYVVTSAKRWPFDALKNQPTIIGVVGNEVDSPLYSQGSAVEQLAHSSMALDGKGVVSMATYYTNVSEAGILDMGTNGWVCAIENVCPWGYTFSKQTQNQVRLVTEAILKGLTKGPLGKWRPAITDIPARA